MIKIHEIDEIKMSNSQNVHKNKIYKMATFNYFKNKNNIFLTFLQKNLIKLKNEIFFVLVSLSLKKNTYHIFITSGDITIGKSLRDSLYCMTRAGSELFQSRVTCANATFCPRLKLPSRKSYTYYFLS